MFDIGFTELLLVAIVALLVLGPERLPQALRTLGLWIGRMRRSFNAVRDEIEREIGMDDIRRQLHNEAVMEELRRIEQSVKSVDTTSTGMATQSSRDAPAADAPAPAGGPLTSPRETEPGTDTSPPPAARAAMPTDASTEIAGTAPRPGP
jgi:sec-independent protein translocase protein TatB